MIQSTSENFCTLGVHRGGGGGHRVQIWGLRGSKIQFWILCLFGSHILILYCAEIFNHTCSHIVHISQVFRGVKFCTSALLHTFLHTFLQIFANKLQRSQLHPHRTHFKHVWTCEILHIRTSAHINQIYKINSKFQKLISEFILS